MRTAILFFLFAFQLSSLLYSQEEAPMKILKQKTTTSTTQARIAEAMEVPQDPTKLIPTINGELKVSPEGAALYSLPIETPAGHNGMQPNLALTYNSQAGPGQFGYGWSLNGLSSITRGGKSKRVDGVAQGPQFTEDDPLYLDGMRLVPHPNGKPNEYTTEKYANLKVVRNMTNSPEVYIWAVPKTCSNFICFPVLITEADIPNYQANYNIVYDELPTTKDEFVVYYPDGRKAFYMQDSRLLGQFLINRMEDTFGNKITYLYNVQDGVAYIQRISYLDKPESNNLEYLHLIDIDFTKQINPQETYAYRNGLKMTNKYYINQVVVMANHKVYREYNLQHDTNSNGEKRLVGARIKNANGEELKPLSFQYESLGKLEIPEGDITQNSLHVKKNLGLPPNAVSLGATALGDFDGDGKQEAVYIVEVEKNKDEACEEFLNETTGIPSCTHFPYSSYFNTWFKDNGKKHILWHETKGLLYSDSSIDFSKTEKIIAHHNYEKDLDELFFLNLEGSSTVLSDGKYKSEYNYKIFNASIDVNDMKVIQNSNSLTYFKLHSNTNYNHGQWRDDKNDPWKHAYGDFKPSVLNVNWLVNDFNNDGKIDFLVLTPNYHVLKPHYSGTIIYKIDEINNKGDALLFSYDGTNFKNEFIDLNIQEWFNKNKSITRELKEENFWNTPIRYYHEYTYNEEPDNINTIEFNGDGLSEISYLDKDQKKLSTYILDLNKNQLIKIHEESNLFSDNTISGDFNGDGITDFLLPQKVFDISKEANLAAFVEKIETSNELKYDLYIGTGKGYVKDTKDLSLNNLAHCNTGNKVIPRVKKTSSFWRELWSGPKFEDNSYFEYATCSIIPMDFNGDGKTDLVSFKKVGAANPEEPKKFLSDFKVRNEFSNGELVKKEIITKVKISYHDGFGLVYEYENKPITDLSSNCPIENRRNLPSTWRRITEYLDGVGGSSGSSASIVYDIEEVDCAKIIFNDLNKLSFHENVFDATQPDGIFFEPYLAEDQVLDLGKIAISPYSFFIGGTQNIKNKSIHEMKQDLRLYDPHQKNNIHFNLQRETGENRLVKVENGSGLAQYIEYGTYENGDPLSAYQKTDKHKNIAYPYQVLEAQPGNYLVSKIHTEVKKESADQAKTITQEYRYQDAIIHLDGLGALGFGQTLVSDPYISDCKAYNSGTHEFTIEECKKNSQESNPVFWTRSVQDPLQEGQTVEVTYGDLSGSKYFSKSTKTYQKFTKPGKRYVWYPTQEISEDKLKGITTTQNNFYDPNLLLLTKTTTDISGEYSTQTEFFYEHTSNEDLNFYYGRITRVKTTQTNSKTGDTFSTEERSVLYPHGKAKTTTKKGNGTGEVKTHYTYDSYGNATSERLEAVVETADGTQQTVDLTTTTEYQYNFTNLQHFLTITATNPEGQTATVVADVFGKKQKETSVLGLSTQYFYDSWGNPEKVIDALGHETRTKNQSLENGIYTKSVEKAGQPKSLVFYNRLDQAFRTKTQSLGGKWILQDAEYDLYGREFRKSQPYFEGETPSQWDTNYYDELGRPIKQVLHTGKIIETCYEGRTVTVTDDYIKKSQTQDAAGKTIESTDRGGTVNYTYYPNGTLKEANYDGVIVKVTQDGWGNKTKLEDPSAGTYEYQYDNLGRMLWEKTPKGITKHWYDRFGKPTQEETIGDETYLKQTFVYDAVSKLPTEIKGWNQNVASPNFSYKTHYDQYYRITGKTEQQAVFVYETQTLFDDSPAAGGRAIQSQSKVTLTTGEISEVITRPVYDANGIMTELKDGNNQRLWAVTATNARGQVEQLSYGNGFLVKTEYDEFGLPKLLKDHHSSKGTALEMAYQFDAARGLLKNRTNKLFNLQESFGFDELNRLIEQNQNGSKDLFSYDNRGRITGSTDMGKYSYFPDNYQLKQIEHNDEGNAHRELFGDLELTYNSHKKPTEIVGKLGTYQFAYNPLQTRAVMRFFATGNTEPSFTKIYSADNAIEVEIRNGQTRILTFVDGGPYEASVIHTALFPLPSLQGGVAAGGGGFADGGGFLYLHKDYLGSVLAISDAQANILEQRSFDAWGNLDKLKVGNLLLQTQAEIVNYILQNGLILDRGYTGHEHLFAVGIINMNGRLYDPALKRFLSPDNFIQDPYNTQNFNRYGYVLNNPLLYTDPSGEFIFSILAGVIISSAGIGGTFGLTLLGAVGLLASAAILDGILMNAIAGNPLHWGIGKAAVMGVVTGMTAYGIGSIAEGLGKGAWLFKAGAHGMTGGLFSELQGGDFGIGLASGMMSSLIASSVHGLGVKADGVSPTKFGASPFFRASVIAGGGLGGGLSASIAGGDFWKGARQGLTIALLNDLAHSTVNGGGPGEKGKRRRESAPTRRRNISRGRDLSLFDERGRELANHWLDGSGEDLVFEGGHWGDYMKSNKLLKRQVISFLKTRVQNARAQTLHVNRFLDVEIENGYYTGYEMLHGPNKDVGGFLISGTGKYSSQTGKWIFELDLIWNDKIDPNHIYSGDTWRANLLSWFYNPKDYNISIKWHDTISF